ncbi:glucuronate isomerase [Candidatus Bipolaricaulota bacterium]|nr:glucuronate isomerase [Candidatus Bipolaricaulota bacterium]
MSFLDCSYLLDNHRAQELFEEIEDLEIYDPHTHADVEEIVENEGWDDIWEVEAETDHYVWELMRKRGVEEKLITGSANNKKKWFALTEVFPKFASNPTYEWVHLDLKRRFGIEETISGDTAETIWEETKSILAKESYKPQQLLNEMNVEVLCSTDDPTMELQYHERAPEEVEGTKILPTWRPDKFMKIEKDSWKSDVEDLGRETGEDVSSLQGFLDALKETHSYFDKIGCLASDHGVVRGITRQVGESRAAEIYRKGFEEPAKLTDEELVDFKSFLLMFFGKLNSETGWVTQLHIGAVRNYRDELYRELGPDSGGDVGTQEVDFTGNLKYFLNKFDGELDIVLYYLDPGDLPSVATLSRAFPNVSIGAPWWFNDSPHGIENQLEYMATVDLLANHPGMVSDSRKLISYGSRIEVFRRSLANTLGKMVERGQMPEDVALELANEVALQRKKELFGFGKGN